MPKRRTIDTSGEPLQRHVRLSSIREVGYRILDRAKAQHRDGVKPFSKARTGFTAIDALAASWWGVTILSGDGHADQVTLASRIALETARAGGRVLWLDLSGSADTPVFRLLTGLARIPSRLVFVEKNLTPDQWEALAAAQDELDKLPIAVADAYGFSIGEIRSACDEAMLDERIDLLVLNGLHRVEHRQLGTLETLADRLDVPVLAVVESEGDGRDRDKDAAQASPDSLFGPAPSCCK